MSPSAAALGCGFLGLAAGGFAQGLGPHDDALAVGLDDQRHVAGAGNEDAGAVERVDVGGSRDEKPGELSFAQHVAAAAADCPKGLAVGAADGLGDRQAPQTQRVTPGRTSDGRLIPRVAVQNIARASNSGLGDRPGHPRDVICV